MESKNLTVATDKKELALNFGLFIVANGLAYFVTRSGGDHSVDTLRIINAALASLPLLLSSQGIPNPNTRLLFRLSTCALPLLLIYVSATELGGLDFFTSIILLVIAMLFLLWRDKARRPLAAAAAQETRTFSTSRVAVVVAIVLLIAAIGFIGLLVYSFSHLYQ